MSGSSLGHNERLLRHPAGVAALAWPSALGSEGHGQDPGRRASQQASGWLGLISILV